MRSRFLSRTRVIAAHACLLAAVVAGLAGAAGSRESEILLRTRRFAGSLPQRAVADFFRDVAAAVPRLQASGEPGALSRERTIRLLDTTGSCALRAHGYGLREEVDDGTRRLTLAGGSGGRSADLRRPLATMGEVLRLFPELRAHRFNPREPVAAVNDLTILERVYAGASAELGGEEATLAVVLWYTEPLTRPLAAAVVVSPAGKDATDLVAALRRMVQWVEPEGGSRTDIVYRGFCR